MPGLARRTLLFALPLAILVGYLLWAFLPSWERMPGFGDDPAFNAWHFLHLFRSFDRLGPWALFSRELWSAPIFAPGELHLALSENQLWPALLMWPLWKASGGLVFTLGVGMFALHLAAFGAASGWLGALGVRDLRWWGGLCFALCGWLQDQYAHWQNGCVFLLPLALWAWARFREKPGNRQLLLCALAFGWIIGWNLYFAVMMGYLFAALLVHAFLTKSAPRARLAVLAILTLLIQSPIAWRYAQLAAQVGQFAAWDSYPAGLWSWLGRFARPSLLEQAVRGWPRAHPATIEAAGFVGIAWAALSLLAVIRKGARWPLLLAACAFWISLGLGYGLLDALVLLPPFSALRAIGRFQLGVMLGTLPAVFLLLEEWRGVRRWLPLALVLLELWPAGGAQRVRIPREIDGPPTPLEAALSSSPAPLLVLDDVSSTLQLALLRSGAPIFEGYTGRPSPTGDLLFELAVRRRAPVADLLDLTQATRVLASGWRIAEERGSPRLRLRDCYLALGVPVCLFDATSPPPPEPPFIFGADTEARFVRTPAGVEGLFFARRAGRLAFDPIASCRVLRVSAWPLFTLERDIGIEGHSFSGIRFAAGALVYRKEIHDEWNAWPAWMRPKLSERISCAPR